MRMVDNRQIEIGHFVSFRRKGRPAILRVQSLNCSAVFGEIIFGVVPGAVGIGACSGVFASVSVSAIIRVSLRPFRPRRGTACCSSVVVNSACDFTVAETEAYLAGR